MTDDGSKAPNSRMAVTSIFLRGELGFHDNVLSGDLRAGSRNPGDRVPQRRQQGLLNDENAGNHEERQRDYEKGHLQIG